jgi:hypothetical protein
MSTTLTTVSNDDLRQVGQVETLSAAATLTAEESGKLLILSAAAGAQVTLPAVATSAGFSYKFVVGATFATTAWTIKAATSVIQGGAIVNSVNVPSANRNTITFAHAAETVGDTVQLSCDGTNWYVTGVGTSAASITFTTV